MKMFNLFDPFINIYKALYLLAFDITGNYGLALIVLSLFTFIFLYPFNKKAQQIQKKEYKIQTVLAPQIENIKKQYSGREQYNNLQWLYRRYGYHPLYAVRSSVGFIIQIPFLTAAYYMLSGLAEIQGVSWGIIPNLGAPDHLLAGVNVLPFVMTMVTCIYAFVMPDISKKEKYQTVAIGVFFLLLLYNAPSSLLIFWTCNLIWSLLDSVLSKRTAFLGDYISENELAFHIIISLSLTVCLFVPLEIYIKNADKLWFELKDIVAYFLIDSVEFIVILLIGYAACRYIKVKVVYLSLLLGLLLGIFLQSYIIGYNYGIFDGHVIEWEQYTIIGVTNTLVWLLCIGGVFFGFSKFIFEGKKNIRIVKPVTFGIMVLQLAVLFFTIVIHPIHSHTANIWDESRAGVLTTKDMYTVSSKDNIIVFLLDMFDASVFEEIQNRNPEVVNDFKDFTYYPDSTSSYGATDYSLPEILTGEFYDFKERYPNYIEKAWNKTPYFNIFHVNNYSITLYTSGNFIGKNNVIDNYLIEKVKMDDRVVDQFRKIGYFRMAPHYLKKFYYNYDANIQNPVIFSDSVRPYLFDDRFFYEGLQKGLVLTEKENAFRFYHLNGMHPPYIYDENLSPVKEGTGTAYQQALGALKIVREYITQMQRHNVYDNTTFVVLADHGYWNTIGSRPVLLVKQPKTNQKKLLVSDASMTVSALMPVIIQRFKSSIPIIDMGISLNGSKDRYYYLIDDKGEYIKYKIAKGANDLASWTKLDKIDTKPDNNSADRSYTVGETIDLSSFGNGYKYKTKGWSARETVFGSSIVDHEAELVLDLKKMPPSNKGLILKAEGYVRLGDDPDRIVRLYVNDVFLGDWHVKETGKIDLISNISAKLADSSSLKIRFRLDATDFERDDLGFTKIRIIAN